MIDFSDPVVRDQVERYIGDPERCMPSERARMEAVGFVAKEEECTIERFQAMSEVTDLDFAPAAQRPPKPEIWRFPLDKDGKPVTGAMQFIPGEGWKRPDSFEQ